MHKDDKKEPLLQIKNLSVQTALPSKNTVLLDNVSFTINPGETTALLGESGSGKTLTALAVMDLLPEDVQQVSGEIIFRGLPLTRIGKNSFAALRGKQISMIFQEPVSALNPVFKIGDQLTAVIRTNSGLSISDARAKALECLQEVGLPQAQRLLHHYPHQLSGGMAQRIMIAMALSCRPALIIADEPTTALDVTTQLKILNLMVELQKKHTFALLIISHDMRIVSALAGSVVILKKGKVVYQGNLDQLLKNGASEYIRSFSEMI